MFAMRSGSQTSWSIMHHMILHYVAFGFFEYTHTRTLKRWGSPRIYEPDWKKTNWSGTTEKRTRTEEQRRAQRLSLHTSAHPRFIPEGLPSDLRRSPTTTRIGCLTTLFLFTCVHVSADVLRIVEREYTLSILSLKVHKGKVKPKKVLFGKTPKKFFFFLIKRYCLC